VEKGFKKFRKRIRSLRCIGEEVIILSQRRRLERRALATIAGTPTKSSSDEAKLMARVANDALQGKNFRTNWGRKFF